MAYAGVQSVFENELSCPVCMELFVDDHKPKDLPGCDHVICAECLTRMVTSYTKAVEASKAKPLEVRPLECPECREKITIPEDGVSALRTNRKIRNLAEEHLNVQKRESGGERVQPNVPMCPQHKEKMSFICISCNGLICQICLVRKHNGHNIEEVKERYAKQKDQMQNMLHDTLCNIKQCMKTLKSLKELKNQVKDAQRNEEEKIDKFVDENIAQIMMKAQDLKTDLEKAGIEKQHRISKVVDRLNRQIGKAERDYKQAADFVSRCTEHEYIAQHSQHTENLRKINIEIPEVCENGKAAAVFQKSYDLVIKLGELVPEEKALELTPIQTIVVFGLCPVAWAPKDQLIVVDGESFEKKVWIYHKQQGRYVVHRSWPVDFYSGQKWNPRSLSISADGHIFIANCDSVNVYSPEGGLSIRELKVPPLPDSASCLDITTDGSFVVVGNCNNTSVTVNDQTDTIVRKLETSISPMYITTIHNTHVAISDFYAGKVSVIDIRSGVETLSINIPWVRGMCYDEKTDSLLVVADGGRAIHQHCYRTGKFVSCVANGLNGACDLALSCEGILAVATKKHRVKLYQVQH